MLVVRMCPPGGRHLVSSTRRWKGADCDMIARTFSIIAATANGKTPLSPANAKRSPGEGMLSLRTPHPVMKLRR
jgi:hypothetical protein